MNWYFARAGWLSGRDGRVLAWKVPGQGVRRLLLCLCEGQEAHRPGEGAFREASLPGACIPDLHGKGGGSPGGGRLLRLHGGGRGPACTIRIGLTCRRSGLRRPGRGRNSERVRRPKSSSEGHPRILSREAGLHHHLWGRGPAFRPGARVETMGLVDEGPTLAAALGIAVFPGGRKDSKKSAFHFRELSIYRRRSSVYEPILYQTNL